MENSLEGFLPLAGEDSGAGEIQMSALTPTLSRQRERETSYFYRSRMGAAIRNSFGRLRNYA
jgi:hypothetical protein